MRKPYKYLRGQVWWVGYVDLDGTEKQRSTGCSVAQEDKAERVRRTIETRLTARARVVGEEGGPLTVRRWAKVWIDGRKARGISTASDYQARLELHVFPRIGDVKLEDVTPEHVIDIVNALAARGLAPRTIRHVYFTMHAMFRKAIPRLLDVNPCSLDTDDLPGKIDKDPEWRATAVFSKEEVEAIIFEPSIPEDRRIFYTLLFLGAMRFGEVAATPAFASISAAASAGAKPAVSPAQ